MEHLSLGNFPIYEKSVRVPQEGYFIGKPSLDRCLLISNPYREDIKACLNRV